MTDYNLLAKAEVVKYYKVKDADGRRVDLYYDGAKAVAATAIQGIIDALGKVLSYQLDYDENTSFIVDEITHYTTLKQAIQDYKP